MLKLLRKPWVNGKYWKFRYKGLCQDIFFHATLNRVGEFTKAINEVATKYTYPTADIGVYLQPVVQGTGCHCEFNLFYDPAKRPEAERVERLSLSATGKLLDQGAFFSRPYGGSAASIFNRDAATVAALRKIKAIADPNNVMNPGKLCF